MAFIGVTASGEKEARPYVEALQAAGARVMLFLPGNSLGSQEMLASVQGLLVSGGPDISPECYGERPDPGANLEVDTERDRMELPLLKGALERDMPVLAICRGMQALNVVLGGKLVQDVVGHKAQGQDGTWESAYHRIWVSPGSKLAAILGSGGQVRVNSRHHQGLREAQKSSLLIASAYSLEDHLIEALESPHHRFALGVQCHPERTREVPKQFARLFEALVEQAAKGFA